MFITYTTGVKLTMSRDTFVERCGGGLHMTDTSDLHYDVHGQPELPLLFLLWHFDFFTPSSKISWFNSGFCNTLHNTIQVLSWEKPHLMKFSFKDLQDF